MLALIVALAMAAHSSNAQMTGVICKAGRAALEDLPSINYNPRSDSYYSATDPILTKCPNLKRHIPREFPLSDLDAYIRASQHVPIPGRAVRPAYIYAIGLPQFSDDYRTATFEMGYTCTGLCGGTFIAHYVRIGRKWLRDGAIRITSVS